MHLLTYALFSTTKIKAAAMNQSSLKAKVTDAVRKARGYYKVARFDSVSMTWKDGRCAYDSHKLAVDSIKKPGRYRLSLVDSEGRHDLEPFTHG
jgi:hypothetical protein